MGRATGVVFGGVVLLGWAAGSTGLSGCTGLIGGDGSGVTAPTPGPERKANCELDRAPIERLTPREYRNTLATLFPGVALPDEEPVPDERIGGFIGHHDGQSVSALGVRRYEELARTTGEAAAADLDAWAPCSEDAEACLQQITTVLAPRTYRRPLTEEEADDLSALASSAYAEFGMTDGVAVVVQALLESPWFLYRPQFGTGTVVTSGVAAGGVPLDAYEMASRLSYFFLDDMPDEELRAAAEAGALTRDADVEAQARRLLADPRARPVVTGFFAEWLRLYKLDDLGLDPQAFPEFDEQLRADLETSVRMFLERAIWEEDSWTELTRGSFGFVNDRLAPIFGVAPPGTDELVLVALDPGERKGVLTQPGLLASTSHGISHSPIFRGVTVLESIMCHKVPAPPPGILDDIEDTPIPDDVCTTRQQVALTHTVGNCQGCHRAIDGAGFTFERYDALGRYRLEENGCEVDPSGDFVGTLGAVADAIEMAEKLTESPDASACMVENMLGFALSRSAVRGDTCEVEALAETLLAAAEAGEDDSLQEMVVRVVLSPLFRHRPAPQS
ncbi:MAG: DUF1592 domain-containing protein [Myxococcota bacterium]